MSTNGFFHLSIAPAGDELIHSVAVLASTAQNGFYFVVTDEEAK
jgi:hypothetical protein